MELELHLPHCHSLKDKRAVVKTILHGAQNRFGVSVAEVDYQDKWQRASLGFAVVSGRAGVADDVLAKVERFVLSFPEVELIAAHWGLDG
ncbi:MAG TPA: DUF503 domain-containing protein [Acidimicrobiales bacterium]|nr:DUF503 domain-containing protein [Acidimicrobiales bacterium]